MTPQPIFCDSRERHEPPFANEFWDHHRGGLYVDIVSGVNAFTSTKKFDSGCGCPVLRHRSSRERR